MVMYTCHLSTEEAEPGTEQEGYGKFESSLVYVSGHPEIYRETYLKKKKLVIENFQKL